MNVLINEVVSNPLSVIIYGLGQPITGQPITGEETFKLVIAHLLGKP